MAVERLQMGAYLVGSAAVEFGAYELCFAIHALCELAKRAFGRPAIFCDAHLEPVFGVPPKRALYDAVLLEREIDKGEVVSAHLFCRKLTAELFVGAVVFGYHHQAACLLVQPVDNTVTLLAADGGEGDAALFQPVHKSWNLDAWGIMDYHK